MGKPVTSQPRFSIKTKIAVMMVASALVTQLLTVTVLIRVNLSAARRATAEHAAVVARMVADGIAPALTFGDKKTAQEILRPFSNDASVDAIFVFDQTRRVFAEYRSPHAPVLNDLNSRPPSQRRFTKSGRHVHEIPIKDNLATIGKVLVVTNNDQARRNAQTIMLAGTGLVGCALFATILMSSLVQRRISNPIIQLASNLREVTQAGNYGKRVSWKSADEIGDLYAAVNDLLSYADRSQRDLQASHVTLETRVKERTKELSLAVASLREQIEQRRRAEEDLRRTQAELLDAARKAGMAEIATGVLHNIGNVLNSINVSTGLLMEQTRASATRSAERAAELIQKHRDDLADFLTQDERGKHFPAFFIELAAELARERETMVQELRHLEEKVGHIKQIVATQQSFAKSRGLLEQAVPRELLEVAKSMGEDGLHKYGIIVCEEVGDVPTITTDRNKVIQILINLINNARDAMRSAAIEERRLTLGIRRDGDDVVFSVRDTGEGIPPDHLTTIFQHGFTTKDDGHGFGLHSAALAASELGGTLTAESEGKGRGATFVLRLPIAGPKRKQGNAEADAPMTSADGVTVPC